MSMLNILFTLLVFLCALIPNLEARAEKKSVKSNSGTEETIKYRSNEVLDFGALSIKGNILAPDDLTVKLRERAQFHEDFSLREDFDSELDRDLQEIR